MSSDQRKRLKQGLTLAGISWPQDATTGELMALSASGSVGTSDAHKAARSPKRSKEPHLVLAQEMAGAEEE